MNRTTTAVGGGSSAEGAGRTGSIDPDPVPRPATDEHGSRGATGPGSFLRRGAGLAALALALGVGGIATAEAARFGVRVVDGGGEPVAGASVCVGLAGNYRQFGTAFTDLDGRAELVEVPNVPFVVTVSKTRFTGTRTTEPARGYDVVREITLTEGLPGPRCKAGSSMAANPPVIDVRGVDVLEDVAAITLRPTVTGEPGEYRLGLDESFEGAAWQRFERSISVPGALAGEPSLYLQLRRYEGGPRGWLEARSNVVTIALPARDR